jgi:hypothetical protein
MTAPDGRPAQPDEPPTRPDPAQPTGEQGTPETGPEATGTQPTFSRELVARKAESYAAGVKSAAVVSAAGLKSAAEASATGIKKVNSQHNIMAVVAVLLSAFSILTVGVLAPIGAVLGHIALRQIRARGQTGSGMARSAIVIGWGVTAFVPCAALCTGGALIFKIISVIGSVIALFS